jgi:parallel beta-helix repeat protein
MPRPSTLLVAGLAALALGVATAPAGADDVSCTQVASPGDSVNSFVNSLDPGDVGCLHGGTYHENVSMHAGGNGDDSRIVVRSYPGERATLAGRLTVYQEADYVTFEQLVLDGQDSPACDAGSTCDQLPSPTVNGDHLIFQDNEVTNHHVGICFNLGNPGYGRPQGVVIQRNRIHDCGRMNPVSNHDHGIYVAYADNTKILSNVIYDNADRGIQLYPDAQHTLMRGNIIDGNGEGVIFSGAGDTTSNDNVLENNVITNSRLRHDVETWWADGPGHGNVVRNNCVFGGNQGEIADQSGYDVFKNLKVDPQYVDRKGKDFRLRADSPCAAVLDGAALPDDPSDFKPGKHQSTPPPGRSHGGGRRGSIDLTDALLKHSRKHHGRWRLRVYGRVSGMTGTPRGIVQVLRGGSWQRIGVRRLHHRFKISVDPRIPRSHRARATKVRILVVKPKLGATRPVPAWVVG